MAQVLQSLYNFNKQKFPLSFNSPKITEQYKLANPKALFLQPHKSLTDVWLPLPLEMSFLLSSPNGMIGMLLEA